MWSPARTTTVSPGACSITLRFCRTASAGAAIPLGHSAACDVRAGASGRRPGCGQVPRPAHAEWSLRERGLYWVRTTTLSMSELTQLESAKSMIRYLARRTARPAWPAWKRDRTGRCLRRQRVSPPECASSGSRGPGRGLSGLPRCYHHRRSSDAGDARGFRQVERAVAGRDCGGRRG